MNIDTIAAKLKSLDTKEFKGKPLELLGLFLRDESQELWDLVIASPKLTASERKSFEYIANQLRKVLTDKEISILSRIVILDHRGVVLNSFIKQFEGRNGFVEVHYTPDTGTIIRGAYIIVARSLSNRSTRKGAKKQTQKKQ